MNGTQPQIRRFPALIFATALVAIASAGAASATDGAPQVAATVYANGVDFLPAVDFRGATVTVSGPSGSWQLRFGARDRLSIGLFDPDDRLLADGTYTFTLALTPGAVEARELRRAARNNGGDAPESWQPLSGAFTVRDGRVADPNLVEASPRRPSAVTTAADPTDLAATRVVRSIDDGDEAVATGRAAEAPSRRAGAATPLPAARAVMPDSDAASAAAGSTPVQRAAAAPPAEPRRNWATEGKSGRE